MMMMMLYCQPPPPPRRPLFLVAFSQEGMGYAWPCEIRNCGGSGLNQWNVPAVGMTVCNYHLPKEYMSVLRKNERTKRCCLYRLSVVKIPIPKYFVCMFCQPIKRSKHAIKIVRAYLVVFLIQCGNAKQQMSMWILYAHCTSLELRMASFLFRINQILDGITSWKYRNISMMHIKGTSVLWAIGIS